MNPEYVHNQAEHRYEAQLHGEVIGVAEYRDTGATVDFNHTFVEPAHRGGDIATNLVRFALDDMAGQQRPVVASCSYVREWLAEHPDHPAAAQKR